MSNIDFKENWAHLTEPNNRGYIISKMLYFIPDLIASEGSVNIFDLNCGLCPVAEFLKSDHINYYGSDHDKSLEKLVPENVMFYAKDEAKIIGDGLPTNPNVFMLLGMCEGIKGWESKTEHLTASFIIQKYKPRYLVFEITSYTGQGHFNFMNNEAIKLNYKNILMAYFNTNLKHCSERKLYVYELTK